LVVPDNAYSSEVTINSIEFSRICRELAQLSDNLVIETKPDFVEFSVESDVGSGSIRMGKDSSSSLLAEEQTTLKVEETLQ